MKRSAQAQGGADSDHHSRLIEAMVEAASEHGYAGATVSQVVGLAGVSRATFYEHFSDREECFLAAYRTTLEDIREAVRVTNQETTSEERPKVVLEALLGKLTACPALARLILVEALAAPDSIRGAHEELIVRIDEEIAGFLERQQAIAAIQIPATALLGGVGEVLATRAISGPTASLPRLRDDLMGWIDAYRLPNGMPPIPQDRWRDLGRFAKRIRREGEESPVLLPRGRSALPPEDAANRRRKRIIDATVSLVAAEGYRALTVARIATAARVPRGVFYSHFAAKEDALLAAQTEGMQGAMAIAAAEYALPAPWPERVWRSLKAFLTYVAANPDLAQLDFVESYAAGRVVTLHRQRNRMAFALFLEEGYRDNPRADSLPRFCSEAIGAAIYGMMRKLITTGQTERLLSLLPAAAYTVLAPFVGAEEAAHQVQKWSSGAR